MAMNTSTCNDDYNINTCGKSQEQVNHGCLAADWSVATIDLTLGKWLGL
jgi:hypothetical protein